jgi:hypothetical protein
LGVVYFPEKEEVNGFHFLGIPMRLFCLF